MCQTSCGYQQNKQNNRAHHPVKIDNVTQKDSKIRNRYLSALGFDVEASKRVSSNAKINPTDRYQISSMKETIKLPREEKIVDACEKLFKKPTVGLLQQFHKPTPLFHDKNKPRSSVSFHSTAVVYSVPSRHCFSNRIKNQLWFDSREFTCNAHRNMIEFAFEKHDWRQVLEEDRFFICSSTGNKIHPVHYVRMFSQWRSPFHRVLN